MTDPHNFGRISAPGLVMDVGSIRKQLARYEGCDSFLSTDAGLSWNRVHKNVHMYEFGDSGSILVIMNDEEMTDCMSYSTDFGGTWKPFKLRLNIRARGLTTVSDSTSQKCMLLAQVSRQDQQDSQGHYAVMFLDLAPTWSRQCGDNNFEQCYAHSRRDKECLMGVKNLLATTITFGATMSVPAGLECIPSTMCTTGKADEKYMGSSGYRLIAGNQCDPGMVPRKTIPCRSHVRKHNFEAKVVQHQFFKDSNTILMWLSDNTICPAYLITDSDKFFYMTDGGRDWHSLSVTSPPNSFSAAILRFQPCSDYLIWVGNVGCAGTAENCWAEAQFSRDNGQSRNFIEDYVVNCDWARDDELLVDWMQIICESYWNKQSSQSVFGRDNTLQLISGRDYFDKKMKLFKHVVGFTKFSEFLIVAEADVVSLDGRTLAAGQFPPGMHPNTCIHSPRIKHWINLPAHDRNVNRNDIGFIDFEKLVGLDGIVMVNVVANPVEATLSRSKVLQTWITHNDAVAHTSSIFPQGRMNVETICQLEFNHLMPKSMILLWNGLDKEPEKGRSTEEFDAPDFRHNASTDLIRQHAAEKEHNRKAMNVAVLKLVLKPATAFKETITRRRRLTLTLSATKLMVAPATSTSRQRLLLDPGSTKNYGSSNEKPFLRFPSLFSSDFGLFVRPTIELPLDELLSTIDAMEDSHWHCQNDYKILVNSDVVMQGSPNLVPVTRTHTRLATTTNADLATPPLSQAKEALPQTIALTKVDPSTSTWGNTLTPVPLPPASTPTALRGTGNDAVPSRAVVVKRHDLAVCDNNHIHVTLVGTALTSCGSVMDSLTTPSPAVQEAAIWLSSGRRSASFSGSCTEWGQRVEMEGTSSSDLWRVTSVTAGWGNAYMTSLVKVTMMLENKQVLPKGYFKKPSSRIVFGGYNLCVPVVVEDFIPGEPNSCYGFGGVGGHTVLHEHEPRPILSENITLHEPLYLFAIGFSTLVDKYKEECTDVPPLALCEHLGNHMRQLTWRTFAIADSIQAAAFPEPVLIPKRPSPLVLCFSGQGPQHWQQGRDLYYTFRVSCDTIDECDRVHVGCTGESFMETTGLFKPDAPARLIQSPGACRMPLQSFPPPLPRQNHTTSSIDSLSQLIENVPALGLQEILCEMAQD
ncbi:hypothetical protein BU15DRAFT_63862 [Melanogaster broomeanus]|nr:hypothetical protein BU15DRAFT_63862 [Melanogaster broomeanus]